MVREGKRIVSLPHFRLEGWPLYRVTKDPKDGHVVLSLAEMGVKVVWDGESFVEIILAKRLQSKVRYKQGILSQTSEQKKFLNFINRILVASKSSCFMKVALSLLLFHYDRLQQFRLLSQVPQKMNTTIGFFFLQPNIFGFFCLLA